MAALFLVAAGVFVGAFCVERDGIRNTLNDSMLQIAHNLETIKYLREGKTTNAIDLINANSEAKLLYLMRYDDLESENPDFIRRKKKVLTNLSKEWAEHPRVHGNKEDSFRSDPEWQKYQRDLESYLEKNALLNSTPQK